MEKSCDRLSKQLFSFVLTVQKLLLLLRGVAWPECCMDELVWAPCVSILITNVCGQTLASIRIENTSDELIKRPFCLSQANFKMHLFCAEYFILNIKKTPNLTIILWLKELLTSCFLLFLQSKLNFNKHVPHVYTFTTRFS